MPDDETEPGGGGETQLSVRDGARTFTISTDATHPFRLRRLRVHFIEVEDVHFNHDSVVMLADYHDTAATDDDAAADAQDDDQVERVTALAIIKAVFDQLETNPEQKLLVAGHADRSGSDAYNQSLSLDRAQNVRHVLKGDREAWVDSCQGHHKVEDIQQLLTWMFADHGWDTDPGEIDGVMGSLTRGATRRFQETYNVEFEQSIDEDGVVGPQTWGAFFDVYMKELRDTMGLTEAELQQRQAALVFLDASQEAVGCGENWPITAEHRSRVDRRVELMLFDPGEEPLQVPLACHPSESSCDAAQCELHNPRLYDIQPLPVQPVIPPRLRVLVNLRLLWTDPAGEDRPFPAQFPVSVVFGDGSDPQPEQVTTNGDLSFIVDERKGSFTLAFEHPEASYFATDATATSSSADNERLVTRPDVPDLLAQGFRVLQLPPAWSLGRADFTVDAAKAPTYAAPSFEALDTIETIGTADDPCRVVLDPHWQYLKLVYFDRKLGARHAIPPVVVEGFLDRAAAGSDPDTLSNWVTEPEACQALPWILRTATDDTPLTKPDAAVLIQVRTQAGTFVDSSVEPRRLVTKDRADPGDDIGLNVGENTTVDFAEPSAARLSFYDLPPVWKCRKYHTRWGEPPAQQGPFESVVANQSENAKPHVFSLDDIVLTDPSRAPLSWVPDATTANRVALFANSFAAGPDLSRCGMFKADGANQRGYFTQRPTVDADRNYIWDTPDWTRLAVTQGNLFDVFDQRVADEPDGVVGARAGVQWVDATHDGVGVAPGTAHPRPPLSAGATHPFFAIQPFYELEFFNRGINSRPGSDTYDEWNSPIAAGDGQLSPIGRFDLALLRCCGVDADGDEVAVAFRYYRYRFDFTAKPNLLDDATLAGLGAAARQTQRDTWADTFLTTCADRWNGDDAVNSARSTIVPKGGAKPIKTLVISFLQRLDRNEAHFQIDLVAENQTSNMGSTNGNGELRVNAGRDTDGERVDRNFAGAHETGHAGGMPDEYPRSNNGEGQTGFGSNNVPGAAFSMDGQAMMRFNHRVRARYYWHVAEWLRRIPGLDVDHEIIHGTETYALPHYRHQATHPKRDYVWWPVKANLRHDPTDPVLYDAYLYMLGKDRYATHVLPGFMSEAGTDIDGIVVVVLKARFAFSGWIDTAAHRQACLARVNTRWNLALNQRVSAAFTVAGASAPPAFTKCLLHFSLRFRVGTEANEHVFVRVRDSGSTDFDDDEDPRELDVRVPSDDPGTPAGVTAVYDTVATTFRQHVLGMLGLSPDAAPASSFVKANAYRDIVRSVAGAGVNPTMARRA